jgi:hypothetical protein
MMMESFMVTGPFYKVKDSLRLELEPFDDHLDLSVLLDSGAAAAARATVKGVVERDSHLATSVRPP